MVIKQASKIFQNLMLRGTLKSLTIERLQAALTCRNFRGYSVYTDKRVLFTCLCLSRTTRPSVGWTVVSGFSQILSITNVCVEVTASRVPTIKQTRSKVPRENSGKRLKRNANQVGERQQNWCRGYTSWMLNDMVMNECPKKKVNGIKRIRGGKEAARHTYKQELNGQAQCGWIWRSELVEE